MYTYGCISLNLARMKNVSEKNCTENQNKFIVNNFYFFENRAVYEIMWKNDVGPDRPQTTIWRMRFACWITKATHTHTHTHTHTQNR